MKSLALLAIVILTLVTKPSIAADDTLLGGSMTQHITLWAAPNSNPESLFLTQIATDLRIEKKVWISFNHFSGFRNTSYPVDLYAKIKDAASENMLPDAAIMPLNMLLALENELPVATINEKLFPANKFSDAYISSVKRGDNYFALPIYDSGNLVLYFNRRLVESVPKSWSELEQPSDQNQTSNRKTIALDLTDPHTFCAVAGCQQNMKASYADYVARRFESFIEKYNVEKTCEFVCPEQAEQQYCKNNCFKDVFYKGNSQLLIASDTLLIEATEKLGANLGIAPLPTPLAGNGSQIRYPVVLVFFNDALTGSKKYTSKQLISYFLKKFNQKSVYFSAGLMPAHKVVRESIMIAAEGSRSLSAQSVVFSKRTRLVNSADQNWHPYHPDIQYTLKHMYVDNILPVDTGMRRIQRLLNGTN